MPDLSNTQRSPQLGDELRRSCLVDDEVLDFAMGRLSEKQLGAIHAHLDRCGVCQRLVEEAARERSSEPPDANGHVETTTFRAGDVVAGRYRVQRFIARGGMGEVYEAYDRELQERVALKTVLSTVSDGQRAVRRLKAEVQLARRVSHPNVCRIYDLGTHTFESGTLVNFLTMEFVDGKRLGERLSEGMLTVAETVDIARHLLLGLKAAHAAGVLHRDLKCDNVMLRNSSSSSAAMPIIMDFGLARAIEMDGARVTSGANAFMGTPCYMAPEQLQGAELSTASDVYSFGVVWFEMLTGKLPFSLRAPFERLHKAPTRPSRIRNDVPAGLERVLLRCLDRALERRYSTAGEVLDALNAMDPTQQPAPSARAARRSFAMVALVASCVAGLGAFVVSNGVRGARGSTSTTRSTPSTHVVREAPSSSPSAIALPAVTAVPEESSRATTDDEESAGTGKRDAPTPRRPVEHLPSGSRPRSSNGKPSTSSAPTPEPVPEPVSAPSATAAESSKSDDTTSTKAAVTRSPREAASTRPVPASPESLGFAPFRRSVPANRRSGP